MSLYSFRENLGLLLLFRPELKFFKIKPCCQGFQLVSGSFLVRSGVVQALRVSITPPEIGFDHPAIV